MYFLGLLKAVFVGGQGLALLPKIQCSITGNWNEHLPAIPNHEYY